METGDGESGRGANAFGFLLIQRYLTPYKYETEKYAIAEGSDFWAFLCEVLDKRRINYVVFSDISRCLHSLGLFDRLDAGEIELDVPRSSSNAGSTGSSSYDAVSHAFIFGVGVAAVSILLNNGIRVKLLGAGNYFESLNGGNSSSLTTASNLAERFAGLSRTLAACGVGDWRYTLPGLAMGCFKQSLGERQVYTHQCKEAKQLERASFYGGWVKPLGFGRVDGRVHYLDFNAMYPYLMENERFPSKLLTCWLDLNLSPDDLNENPLSCVAEIDVQTEGEMLPVRFEGQTHYQSGEFRTILAGPELKLAIESGLVTRVTKLCTYKLDNFLQPCMRKLFGLRRRFQKSGDAEAVASVKLLQNSLFGKFAQKSGELVLDTGFFPPIRWGCHREWDAEMRSFTDYRVCAGTAFRVSERLETPGSSPVISAFVTAYGRNLLRQSIQIAGIDNVYYLGTDAILTNTAGMQRLADKNWIHPTTPGKLKISKSADSAVIYDHNFYQIGDEIKQSGVKPDCVRLPDGRIVQRMQQSLREAAFLGPSSKYGEFTVTLFNKRGSSGLANKPFERC